MRRNLRNKLACWGLFLLPFAVCLTTSAVSIWVAPEGNDKNPGTREQPLATVQLAVDRAAKTNVPGAGPVQIVLRGGVFPLKATLTLRGGSFDAKLPSLVITAADHEHPRLSGGIIINGWKPAGRISGLPASAEGKVWVAPVPKIDGRAPAFRELWVNGIKAVRARTPNTGNLARLVAWDKTNQVATIPADLLQGIHDPSGIEMVIDQVWEIACLNLKSIQFKHTNTLVRFLPPASQLEFEHPWPPVIVKTNYQAPFYLDNAIQFLDSPGEWFEDVAAGKLYYWPRIDENMPQSEIVAPVLETLVRVEGDPDAEATHICFKGLTFCHTTWLRPTEQGHVPLQEGMFLLEARKLAHKGVPYQPHLDNVAWIGRPPAAVLLKNAADITFEDCTFTHLAAAGLDLERGDRDDRVIGCVFRDLGGNGLQLGTFSDTNVETHVPWLPSDQRDLCTHDLIANNLVTDCGNEDWGCVGIGIGYARAIRIEHNELFNLPYTGISVGWGWTKLTNALGDNFVHANHVHAVAQRLGDTAGIYLMSAQPGTVVSENAIEDLHMSQYVPDPEHCFYLYLDEGSSFITVRDNWCPAPRFLKNANGPGNVWINNGPMVSETIKKHAGLEPAYRNLLSTQTMN